MDERSVRVEVTAVDAADAAPPNPPARQRRPIAGAVGALVVVAAVVMGLQALAPDEGSDAVGEERQSSTTIPVPTTAAAVAPAITSTQSAPELDPQSIIRADGRFFAIGSGPELRVWQSDDGVNWAELDIELRGSTSDVGQFSPLDYDDGLSTARLAGGGQIVHRLASPDGLIWTMVERIEMPTGGDRIPVGQTSSSVIVAQGQTDVESPTVAMVRDALANPAVLDEVEVCGLERAGLAEVAFFRCDDPDELITFTEDDLKPGVVFEDVIACTWTLQRAEVPVASILVVGPGRQSTHSLGGGQPVTAAALTTRDEFVLLVDDLPGLRRRFGELGDNVGICEGLIVVPKPPTATGAALLVVNDAGEVRRLELPDDADFNTSVSINNGPQIVEAPDGQGALVLLGDDVWYVDLDSGEWSQQLRREVTLTSSGQSVLSSTGNSLLLLGSTMRVGSMATGEWVDVNVQLPEQPNVVYVDDELALIMGVDGRFVRVDLPSVS